MFDLPVFIVRVDDGLPWENGYLKIVQSEKKERENKVRLTNEDIKNGKLTAAKEGMGIEDAGLARHSVECTRGIDWENARILGVENRHAEKGQRRN